MEVARLYLHRIENGRDGCSDQMVVRGIGHITSNNVFTGTIYVLQSRQQLQYTFLQRNTLHFYYSVSTSLHRLITVS